MPSSACFSFSANLWVFVCVLAYACGRKVTHTYTYWYVICVRVLESVCFCNYAAAFVFLHVFFAFVMSQLFFFQPLFCYFFQLYNLFLCKFNVTVCNWLLRLFVSDCGSVIPKVCFNRFFFLIYVLIFEYTQKQIHNNKKILLEWLPLDWCL